MKLSKLIIKTGGAFLCRIIGNLNRNPTPWSDKFSCSVYTFTEKYVYNFLIIVCNISLKKGNQNY